MKTLKRLVYSDSGHAWCKVEISELKKLGIAEKISSYSYMFKDHAYLEEDCDLGIYINALKEKNTMVEFNIKYSDHSRVRTYKRYEV